MREPAQSVLPRRAPHVVTPQARRQRILTPLTNPRLPLYAGATLISLSPVWVKLVNMPPTASGFYRVLIGGGALALYLLATRRRLGLSRMTAAILGGSAVFFAMDLWVWHRSILYVGPGLSTLLGNFQVFFMMLAGALFLNQQPTARQLVAVPMAIFGLLLIVGIDWQGLSPDYRLGIGFGLLTAVMYAGYLLTLREACARSSHRSPVREVAVVSLATALLLGVSAATEGVSLAIPTLADAGWLASYGMLSHCLGWLLIASSLPRVPATDAGLALLLQPTLSFVWDVAFFARPITAVEITGAGIVLTALYLGSGRD
jgi:drug/metabolite transporter (DMT)-like permease